MRFFEFPTSALDFAARKLSITLNLSLTKERGNSSGVEHNLAKVGVEGSNPFSRSNFLFKNFCQQQFSRPGPVLKALPATRQEPPLTFEALPPIDKKSLWGGVAQLVRAAES